MYIDYQTFTHDPRSLECTNVELPKNVPLHRIFHDWRSLLDLTSLYEEKKPRLYFRLGGDVVFSLDKLRPEEVKTCEEDHCWSSVRYWNHCSFLRLRDSFIMFFFRPKDGTDRLFRFTVGQPPANHGTIWDRTRRSIYNQAGFNVKAVLSSFLKLLLRSKDDFATLVFVGDTNYSDEIPISYPGYAVHRRRFQFPNLPIKNILERSDTVEFIGLDFDERSCRSFKKLPANVRELKLHSCVFADGGRRLLDALQSPNHVESFELDQCPICPKVVHSLNSHLLKFRSLSLGMHYQLDENGFILTQKLCHGKHVKDVTIICRFRDGRAMTKVLSDSLKILFRHQQAVRKLSFVRIGSDVVGKRNSEQYYGKSFLEGTSLGVMSKIDYFAVKGKHCRTDYFNHELQKQRLEAFKASYSRHAMLSKAIDADATIAGLDKKTFSILVDNADVLCKS
ncbi:hypothetical protein IV203_014805 [Nitzschia inconspicua]|uniref:Uncharacterized protein n=1 Tax=Nitzschia inconspicua TaxID=303405 RepID=A0A9K3K6X7_9STRA|nr:hypothetical protein IV203_020254 [Nitzschia inconspicua]KAG7358218.1 hypothetical protein IV203_014805 [Nitzschia inconspicua]